MKSINRKDTDPLKAPILSVVKRYKVVNKYALEQLLEKDEQIIQAALQALLRDQILSKVVLPAHLEDIYLDPRAFSGEKFTRTWKSYIRAQEENKSTQIKKTRSALHRILWHHLAILLFCHHPTRPKRFRLLAKEAVQFEGFEGDEYPFRMCPLYIQKKPEQRVGQVYYQNLIRTGNQTVLPEKAVAKSTSTSDKRQERLEQFRSRPELQVQAETGALKFTYLTYTEGAAKRFEEEFTDKGYGNMLEVEHIHETTMLLGDM